MIARNILFIGLINTFFGVFSSCTKDLAEPIIVDDEEPTPEVLSEQNYAGIFSVSYNDGDTVIYDSTWVEFNAGDFNNPQYGSIYPLGGNGTYTDLGDSIEFKQYNAWPAIYDWNCYLAGRYEYEQIGDHLVIHKTVSDDFYKYDLYVE